MSIKAVLIIGGSGFVGTHLAIRLREEHKVFATYSSHPILIPGVTALPLSVGNRSWIKQVIQLSKPDVIVYAPREAEHGDHEPDLQELEGIHSKGIANVLGCADFLQPKLIYLSTAQVFDGERGNYREGEPTVPATPLGKVKISAENLIRTRSLHASIVRTSPLLGRGSGRRLTFLDRLRLQLDRGKPVELSATEVHSFAPIEGLVELVCELIERPAIKGKVLHYGGLTKLSYADVGIAFAQRFGFDSGLIVRTDTHRHSRREARGASNALWDFSLNSSHAMEQLQIKPFLLEECFDLIEKNLVARA